MFLIIDTQTGNPDHDRHGHIKVYSNERAARAACSRNNTCVAPAYPGEKFRRWAVAPVSLSLEYDQGRPVTLAQR